jgi:hypothetical protein
LKTGTAPKPPGSQQTHNVPATLPGYAGYSPLWLVVVYDNADWPAVHDLTTAQEAKVLSPAVADARSASA